MLKGPARAAFEVVALPALLVVLGLELVRVFLTGIVFYAREVEGLHTGAVGVVAVSVFAASFLAPVAARVLPGTRRVVWLTLALVTLRVVEQAVGAAELDFALSLSAVVIFMFLLPLVAAEVQGRGRRAGGEFAAGLLLGVAIDTTIRGSFDTLDLSWQGRVWVPAVAALGLATIGLSWRWTSRPRGEATRYGGNAAGLFALGPILLVEMLLLQNIGQQTVSIGWDYPLVYLWLALANALGIAAVLAASTIGRGSSVPFAVLGALLTVAVATDLTGGPAAGVVLLGQVAIGASLGRIGVALGAGSAGRASPSAALGAGFVLLAVLMFSYYGSYDVGEVLPRRATAPIAAVALALSVATLSVRRVAYSGTARPSPALALLGAALLVVPAMIWLRWEAPRLEQPRGLPVRVISYNVHQGFDVTGRLGLQEIATVIESGQPDIVLLQEVSRGWVIDGSVDMLVWLSQRLGMAYAWGPAADGVWGNAILSRYPIAEASTLEMPNNEELILKRSYTTAVINVGASEPLRVLVTHLHNGADDGALRVPQIEGVIGAWAGRPRTIIAGDLNAEPDSAEIALLRDAGLVDAFIASGAAGPGFTSRPNRPVKRIDYIWLSPDLTASEFSIADSEASDHLPVAARIQPVSPEP
jgi:endonuclease/exonuclease/phosphatase family metal-dependent hydrolase